MIREEIKHQPKRRWFQFRLRTLLVLITLIALLMPWSVPFANEWIVYYSMTAEERETQRLNKLISETDFVICGYGNGNEFPTAEYWEEMTTLREIYSSTQSNDEPRPLTLP